MSSMAAAAGDAGWSGKLGHQLPLRPRSTIVSEFSESEGESDFVAAPDAGRSSRSSMKHHLPAPVPSFPEIGGKPPRLQRDHPSSLPSSRAACAKMSPSTPPTEAAPQRRELFDSSSTSSTIPSALRQAQAPSPVLQGSARDLPFDESEDDLKVGFLNDPLASWSSLCEASHCYGLGWVPTLAAALPRAVLQAAQWHKSHADACLTLSAARHLNSNWQPPAGKC